MRLLRDRPRCLRIVASGLASVDLLLTDLVMPEMSGAKLAEQLRSTHPDLPVLYTSGYVSPPSYHTTPSS